MSAFVGEVTLLEAWKQIDAIFLMFMPGVGLG